MLLDHPLNGLGYPIIKKAKPRKGVVAVSRRVLTPKTPNKTGLIIESYKIKQMAWLLNLYFLFLIAVLIEIRM